MNALDSAVVCRLLRLLSAAVPSPVRVLCSIFWHPAHRGTRARALALGRFVIWQLWKRTAARPILVNIGDDRQLVVEPWSKSAAAVHYHGRPDCAEMAFLHHMPQARGCAVDVGANVGVYTLLMVDRVVGTVYAFEPDRRAREVLMRNLALNGLSRRVQVSPSVVSSRSGFVEFTDGLDTQNRVLPSSASRGQMGERKPCTSLDVELRSRAAPVRVLKIDVEGHELAVLRGAIDILRSDRPVIIVEANDIAGLLEFLSDEKYLACYFDPKNRRLHSWTRDVGAKNIVAVPTVGPYWWASPDLA